MASGNKPAITLCPADLARGSISRSGSMPTQVIPRAVAASMNQPWAQPTPSSLPPLGKRSAHSVSSCSKFDSRIPFRARPQIIESTFDGVIYGFTTIGAKSSAKHRFEIPEIVEQSGDQTECGSPRALRLERLRQPTHTLAGPSQRRSRVTARRRLDQRFEIPERGGILGDRGFASRCRPPNALRGLLSRQFLQPPSDRARCNPGRHRDRRNLSITRGECLGHREQTTAPFVKKGRHRRKPLADGFDIDHHHNIWYGKILVN